MAHPGGRPMKFRSPEELQKAVDNYFLNPTHYKEVKSARTGEWVKVPILTICGLAYSLGFLDRQSFYDYANRKDEYSCIIRAARMIIEGSYEADLRDGNVAGVIFALKNMGWRDKAEVEHSGEMSFSLFNKQLKDKIDDVNRK